MKNKSLSKETGKVTTPKLDKRIKKARENYRKKKTSNWVNVKLGF